MREDKVKLRMKCSREEMRWGGEREADESVALVYRSSANKDRSNEKAEKKQTEVKILGKR